jgi:hypothetical protein
LLMEFWPMSILPPAPWVVKTRKVILWVGFGWPVAVFLIALGEKKGQGVWALIGTMFLSAIFVPPSLVLSLILPTYKSRIIAVPPLLVIVFWWVASQSNTYNGFNEIIVDPYKLLWLTTFTAIGLVIPEHSLLKLWRGLHDRDPGPNPNT